MLVSELLSSAKTIGFPNNVPSNVLAVCAYALISRGIMQVPNAKVKKVVFAALNVGLITAYSAHHLSSSLVLSLLYVIAVVGLYLLTRQLVFGKHWWIAALSPIALLAIRRYAPSMTFGMVDAWVGLSYMAFRLTDLVVIVRNRVTPMPDIFEFLGFAFFAPTIFVGPINSYSTFHGSFCKPNATTTPFGGCSLRMLVGATKLLFLGSVFDRLSYVGILLDGHMHPPIDLLVAAIFYYIFIYCNFSGMCDIAIGTAGLCGIKVSENFNQPFIARNLKDFWNRWHITLSTFMRDMVFSPLSKALITRFPTMVNHAIALSVLIVFVLIGIWHGRELNYLAFGLIHAIGVVTNFYYDLALKKYLTREQLKSYSTNKYIKAAATVVTFLYVSASLFVFANSTEKMQEIFAAIRW